MNREILGLLILLLPLAVAAETTNANGAVVTIPQQWMDEVTAHMDSLSEQQNRILNATQDVHDSAVGSKITADQTNKDLAQFKIDVLNDLRGEKTLLILLFLIIVLISKVIMDMTIKRTHDTTRDTLDKNVENKVAKKITEMIEQGIVIKANEQIMKTIDAQVKIATDKALKEQEEKLKNMKGLFDFLKPKDSVVITQTVDTPLAGQPKKPKKKKKFLGWF